jgi:uncharacterized damage-inducible protein DinB
MTPENAALIDRYENGINVFAEALRGVPDTITDRSPAPGKWSVRQIAVHLADAEVVAATRFRWVAAQPGATIKAYDQDTWANKLHYEKQPIEQAMELFTAVRKATANLLRALPDSAWANTGVHDEHGEMTLKSLVDLYAEHAEKHAKQVWNIRNKFASAAAG